MPGGNSTARPNNRKEKKAAKVNSEYDRLLDQIKERFYDGDLTVDGMDKLKGDLIGPRTTDAYSTIKNRDKKASIRRGNKLRGYKEGGAVKKYMGGGKVSGYKGGGEVCRGGGAAISGTKFAGVK
tara:strand:+ start:122 stop:496 length:375 start_codon:yes stop_codon:yes gene_type:complete